MGWNKPSTNTNISKKTRQNSGYLRACIAAALVVGGGLLWLLLQGPSEEREPAASMDKQERKRVRPVKSVADSRPAEVKPMKLSREETLFAKTNGYVKAAGKMLTEDGRELTFAAPKQGEIRVVHSHGRVYQCDSEGNFIDISPKPIFDNAFEENLIGMAVEGGAFIPGMLLGHNKDEISAMLVRKVDIKPDDSPEVVEKKKAVAALKQDMIDYVKEGGTFDEYVTEMRNQSVRERSLKTEALKEVIRMIGEGDADGAAIFRDKFNEIVEKQGMHPIKLPKRIAEALGEK